MNRFTAALLVLGLVGCASSGDPTIVKKPHTKVAKASILPGSKDIPSERNGVPVDATGAIMFVCANSEKHEDKEVLISKCPACSENNYFYWDADNSGFLCYACTKAVDNSYVKCPDCGKQPLKVRTRATGK